MGRREDSKSARREQIITAARKLMRARNTSGFSMRSLADVAGVSLATPYNLFGSKEAIIAAVMDADLEDFRQALLQDSSHPVELLFRVVTLAAEIFAGEPGFYKAGVSALQTETDAALMDRFGLPRHNLLRDLVIQAVQDGWLSPAVNAESMAFLLGQQMFGWVQAWARDRLTLEDMVNRTRYGFALSLAAVAASEYRETLVKRALEYQDGLPESWQAKVAQAGR